MTAIIYYNVGGAKLVDNLLQKYGVALITNPDQNLIFFHRFAGRINIDADDPRLVIAVLIALALTEGRKEDEALRFASL
jgi:hypothetical protein